MEAPDKIYVREYPDCVAHFWEEKKKDDVVATIPHEYIRKDALIEWLEKRLHEVGLAGMINIIDVIDKLNSM